MSANELARSLGMSGRTLRRRTHGSGVTLRDVVGETLRTLACEALAQGVPVKRIAADLGYADPSAFHRAFRRWTGMTPAQYRAADHPSGLPTLAVSLRRTSA